jgi:hypothetical protein
MKWRVVCFGKQVDASGRLWPLDKEEDEEGTLACADVFVLHNKSPGEGLQQGITILTITNERGPSCPAKV